MTSLIVFAPKLLVLGFLFLLWAVLRVKAWPPVRGRFVVPLLRRRDAYAAHRATAFMEHTRSLASPLTNDRLPDDLGDLCSQSVLAWWKRFLGRLPLLTAGWLCAAAYAWNVGGILSHLLAAIIDAGTWVAGKGKGAPAWPGRAWHHQENLSAMMQVVLYVTLALALVRISYAVYTASPETPRQRTQRVRGEHEIADRGGFFPVLVLLATAAECGHANQWLGQAPTLTGAPRVSLRSAERAVWRAHRTRYPSAHGRIDSHQRKHLKTHAAQVVGALRAAEARQDSDPGQALQDMAIMLVTIAERYSQGRLGRLLNDEWLNADASPMPHESLRLLGLGAGVVLAMTTASLAGVPSEALGPLLGVLAVLGASVFLRGRVTSPADFVDILRSSDRA